MLILRRSHICAVTARLLDCSTARLLDCRVVMVEEAGEILEAHVLTSLGPNTQHLIMIGRSSSPTLSSW